MNIQPSSASASASAFPVNVNDAQLAAPEEYQTELIPNLVGTVAEFLDQTTLLRVRQIDASTRNVVDNRITTLDLSAADAIALLQNTHAEGGNLQHIEMLKISDCDPASLIRLSEIIHLQGAARRPFHLVLNFFDAVDAAAFRPFAHLNLSGLTLKNMRLSPDKIEGLEQATYPITIDCPNSVNLSLTAALRLPTLTSVRLSSRNLIESDFDAIRNHARLTSIRNVSVRASPAQLARMMENPRIETLACAGLNPWRPEETTWLADHPALRVLTFGRASARHIEALARNQRITSLRLSAFSPATMAALPQLANMSALRELHLNSTASSFQATHIEALCAMPLDKLQIDSSFNLGIDADALRLLASASAAQLVFKSLMVSERMIDGDTVARLANNPVLKKLSIESNSEAPISVVAGGVAQLAASVNIQQLDLTLSSATETNDSGKLAWVSAGKPLVDLTLGMRATA